MAQYHELKAPIALDEFQRRTSRERPPFRQVPHIGTTKTCPDNEPPPKRPQGQRPNGQGARSRAPPAKLALATCDSAPEWVRGVRWRDLKRGLVSFDGEFWVGV